MERMDVFEFYNDAFKSWSDIFGSWTKMVGISGTSINK